MFPSARTAIAACISFVVLIAVPVYGEDYPTKPVRLVAGNPGATADILARQLGRRLTERWGQQVVVDNRGGAGATIAADIAARASPDGYTLLMGQLNSHAIAVSLHRTLSYHPLEDFSPISLVASAPQVLIVNARGRWESWTRLADHARKFPAAIRYASAGHGTASHLAAELLKQRAGLDLMHINYKGGAAAVFAVMSGEADTGFVPLSTAWSMLQSGKIKVLAISSMKRFPTLPAVPTLNESGLPNFEAASWFGMFAQARTPKHLVARLNREIVDILRAPAFQQDLLKLGAETAASTPEEFRAFVKREIGKWRDVIRIANIAPQ